MIYAVIFTIIWPALAVATTADSLPRPARPQAVASAFPVYSADSLPPGLVKGEKNVIGQPSGISAFFRKLERLESGAIKRLQVVHIGDSHVQADLWTGQLRATLQDRFGRAGRGLVFPLQLAGTTGQLDLNFSSPVSWESRKSVFRKKHLPLGLSGICLQSSHGQPSFRLEMLDRFHYGHRYDFNRVTIYHGPGETYQVHIPDAAMMGPVLPSAFEAEKLSAHHSRYSLPAFTRRIEVSRADGEQGSTIHGIILDNSNAGGILYHSIGVNGVTFYHYNRAELFWPQLSSLSPDLVIVSLGTNEALSKNFQAPPFREEVRRFLDRLRKTAPGANLLLTTNPDVLRQKKFDNPNNLEVRAALLEAAADYRTAYWDLHGIMGGSGAVRKWREANLAHTDFIHFKKEGYWLQAKLLYEALMKEYHATRH